ncbi:hypothetical protein [Pseudooceanicola aestuarii]|uniref:hypothetical protein n=1 Tax=Pseudooceanicola aestuarii TaxID=2697319 RepID=UPI0013D13796|nr:hypothetical protein [Pseudooceanicola aestuarii]
MTGDLPSYYFRLRENGAFVFRVGAEDRQRRSEMDQIAVVNIRNGEVKPHGDRQLTEADEQAIARWMVDRRATLAAREMEDIFRLSEQMGLAAHWAQSRATDAQLEEVTDELLLAMHDLRSLLVRKKAERLMKKTGET